MGSSRTCAKAGIRAPPWRRDQRRPCAYFETGATPIGFPPGPSANDSHATGAVAPTPGFDQSHAPPGNAACRRVHCASLNETPYSALFKGSSWHFSTASSMLWPAPRCALPKYGFAARHAAASVLRWPLIQQASTMSAGLFLTTFIAAGVADPSALTAATH